MAKIDREIAWFNRLKIAVGQIDVKLGDFNGNAEKIIAMTKKAHELHCNVVVFPEMCVAGGLPFDLLERSDFVRSQISALKDVAGRVGKIVAIVGFVDRRVEGQDINLYDSAAVIFDGRIRKVIDKNTLGAHDGFDERRYFTPGEPSEPFKVNSVPLGILIGDEIMQRDASKRLVEKGASLIIAPMASSFRVGRSGARALEVADLASRADVDVLVANLVGGQDELVFDGASFAADPLGQVLWRTPFCEDGLFVAEIPQPAGQSRVQDEVEDVRQALCLAIRDFVVKNGFSKVIVGLSGGIDSALVATLAAQSLGAENVLGVIMPSEVSAPESAEDAQKLASNLGIETRIIPITPIYGAFMEGLREHFAGKEPGVAEENLQARVRGTVLMALSNKLGRLVLCTGNRSERLVGYATLYGDMVGGFAPLSDVPKTLVYDIADQVNSKAGSEVIPQRIIDKEPSAELRPNQTDAESLGPYESLDPILEGYVDEGKSFEELLEAGHDEDAIRNALSRFMGSEFKRYQGPPGPRIVSRVTASERRMPLTKAVEAWFARRLWES